METPNESHWERSLQQLAARFEYPPTPRLAGRRADRRPPTADSGPSSADRSPLVRRPAAVIALIAIIVAAALLAAPPTRAAIVAFFVRVGAIDIFIDETAPTPAPPTAAPAGVAPSPLAGATATATATPRPTTTPDGMVAHSLSLIDLGQPTTLEEAERLVGFRPGLPAALGQPDEVYHHRNVDLPAITLVWRPAGGPPLSLTAIGVAEFARKFVIGAAVTEVTVGDATGYWLAGPHHLQLFDVGQDAPLLIASNVLIWVRDGITYRLEGDVSRDDALAIAESLAP